ncbi:MAG TPA: recombinase A [Kofleriaceae bacterium]|nr:recombinase A [Kofleriaceae bacterium]
MSDELERFLANARGSAATAKVMSLDELRARRGHEVDEATWSLATLRGRLVELSARGASATLTTAMDIVVDAQTQHEPVAWLTAGNGTFYPPDVAECGVDLAALVVVRAPDAMAAARAAERVLRSGAFGLVVIDLGAAQGADLSMQIQGRLVTLAQTHDAAVVCLTEKSEDTASLGSLVSLRAEALRRREPRTQGEFSVSVRVLKDKRRGPGWTQTFKRRGPAGLT